MSITLEDVPQIGGRVKKLQRGDNRRRTRYTGAYAFNQYRADTPEKILDSTRNLIIYQGFHLTPF